MTNTVSLHEIDELLARIDNVIAEATEPRPVMTPALDDARRAAVAAGFSHGWCVRFLARLRRPVGRR